MRESDRDYSLTEEEYLRWYLPHEALASAGRHLGNMNARRLILKRIADEDLFSSARKIIVKAGNKEQPPRHFERLSKLRWADGGKYLHHPFWETADIVFTEHAGTMRSPHTNYSCVEVRFDPDGVDRLVPAPSTRRREKSVDALTQMVASLAPPIEQFTKLVSAPPPIALPAIPAELSEQPNAHGQLLRPKVSRAELKAWIADFWRRNPDSSFQVIFKNAELAFPHQRVTQRPTKDAIAELGYTLKVGNPSILRKNRRIGNA